MDAIIDAIRAALAKDAAPDARATGLTACRSILAALEPKPTSPPSIDAAEVAKLIATARTVPAGQLLDLAIARLRGALPAGTEAPAVKPFSCPLVPVSPRRS